MLAGYVRILRGLATVPLAEFEADPRNFGSAERFLQGDFDRFAAEVVRYVDDLTPPPG